MSQRKEQLIRILQRSGSRITGKELAKQLSVSPRTVINYVNQINSSADDTLIFSDQEGYYLNPDAIFEENEDSLPQDSMQRMFYLLKLLILSGEEGMNAFDAADELAVSYSLLKKEISEMNPLLKTYGVTIRSRNNVISAEGEEKAKRRTMTALLRKMQGDMVLNMDVLRKCFGTDEADQVERIIKKYTTDDGIYINDFSKMNLILHLCIIADRLMLGEQISGERTHRKETAAGLSGEIIHELEESFGIQLNDAEYEQMDALIKAHVHLDSGEEAEYMDERDTGLFRFLKETMERVRDRYYLDFTEDAFLLPFSLHIEGLMVRLKNNILIDNPIKETFRSARPFLYDVAMYIMNAVMDHYGETYEISDNEFTFLVMHLTLELERQKQNSSNVHCLLYFPQYLGIEKELKNKIQIHFEDMIHIVAAVHSWDEIAFYEYDILISFVNMDLPANKKYVQISPLMSREDYSALNEAITRITQEKLLRYFRNVFALFFEKENFLIETEKIDKYEAIHRLCSVMKVNGAVQDGFEEQVIQRENAIPTGYINFAVPHAVSTEVLKQSVGVMILPDGMMWGDKQIYCVMLMAVNPHGLEEFQSMYNALLLILMETRGVELFRKAGSFEEFRDLILSEKMML